MERCASCLAAQQSATLSRCSRCRWVAYCSKTCQRAHWTAAHRATCAALQTCGTFRTLETNWWRARSEHELRALVAEHGLDPDSMSFFGEVLFLLSGLKPVVMFSNLPAPWRRSFARDVIIPSGVLQQHHSDSVSGCAPVLHVVGSSVETPAGYDMSGDLVLVNTSLPGNLAAATASLRLRPVPQAAIEDDEQLLASSMAHTSDPIHVVREEELARLLDYPVALSECREPMVEVGYFLAEGVGSQHLLTSYCASEAHGARVAAHFARYRAHFAAGGALHLALVKTRI